MPSKKQILTLVFLSFLQCVPAYAQENRDKTETLTVQGVTFLQEKTGKVETTLKNNLTKVLAGFDNVKSGYLVLVQYHPSQETGVALCLEQTKNGQEQEIVSAVSREFSAMFSSSEALDIIFITPKQKQDIDKIAKPFYERSSAK